MSRLIKSKRVNLSDTTLKLNSELFISKDSYFGASNQAGDEAENKAEGDEASEASSLIESAEKAALDILDQAQAAADKLIEEARMAAREIEADALQKSEILFENTRKRAYEEAHDEAYEKGREEAESLIQEALDIKANLIRKNEEFMIDKEAEVIKLVLAVCEKVLSKEIQDLDYIESLVAQAMKQLNYATDIVLRVSEKDLTAVTLARPKILAMAERIENLEIKADYALSPGSLIIDTTSGSIDASVKTQLERVRDMFMNILALNDNV